MKIMNKFQKKLANRKKDNKGFSLVELIIVIAIMAILVGIVGTQVIPYISKSKVAKDQQVLNSISTAAVAAYSENGATSNMTIDVFGTAPSDPTAAKIQTDIKTASGYDDLAAFKTALGSDAGKNVTTVTVTFDSATHKATTSVTPVDPKYPIKDVEATL